MANFAYLRATLSLTRPKIRRPHEQARATGYGDIHKRVC